MAAVEWRYASFNRIAIAAGFTVLSSITSAQPVRPTATPPAKPPASSWQIRQTVDQMTGGKILTAISTSRNTITFGFPYGGPQRATLQLRHHPRHGYDAVLRLPSAQFLCDGDDCELLVRADDLPPVKVIGSPPADRSTNMIFIDDFAGFIDIIQGRRIVRIEATFYKDGNRVMEFNVAGVPKPWRNDPPEQERSGPSADESKAERAKFCRDAAEYEPEPARRAFIAKCERGE